MPASFPGSTRGVGDSSGNPRISVADRLAQFENRQRQLWRVTYLLLGLLTLAYVTVSWERVRSLAQRYEALLVGLVGLIALFIANAGKRNKEIAKPRGLGRVIEQGSS